MNNEIFYIFIAIVVLNILVNMFMIYNICDKIEQINKEVHLSNSYVVEKLVDKKGGK